MSVPSLTSLLKQSQITDHEELLKAANAALKSSKNDVEAQHIKVIALLKLDRFEDAVRAVESGAAGLKEQAKLEYAYALYKSGKRKQAAEIAASSSSRGLQHVEAQSLYSLEEFVRASELYKSLSNNAADDNIADLRVNTLAVNAQLEWNQLGQHVEEKVMTREDFEAHETVYNTACISIARGELGQCEVLLKRAKQLCENLQDLSEEEKASEMLPITLQHIFVLTRLGRHDEAEELANSIDLDKAPDALTKYIAKVNSAAVQKPDAQNPFLLERHLTVDLDKFEPSPPFAFQKAAFTRNKYALDLGAMKFDGTAAAAHAAIAKEAAPTAAASINTLSVANAAARARNQSGKDALKNILPLLDRRPNDVGLVLTIAQIHALNNNTNASIELLQNFLTKLEQSGFPDVRYAPGLVGSMVGLYDAQGRKEQVRSELSQAAAHWHNRSKDWSPGIVHLLKAAGSALLNSQDAQDRSTAESIFQQLCARDRRDKYAAAGLLAASDRVQEAADVTALISLDKLTSNVDSEALERSGIAQRSASDQQQHSSNRKRPAASAADTPSAKTKKVRKTKMPKEYDPGKTPDPERWLPLRDRSSYRAKGRKNKARQAMLSQGAAVVGESDGSRPTTPAADVMKPKQAQGGASKKKKAAKGKK